MRLDAIEHRRSRQREAFRAFAFSRELIKTDQRLRSHPPGHRRLGRIEASVGAFACDLPAKQARWIRRQRWVVPLHDRR